MSARRPAHQVRNLALASAESNNFSLRRVCPNRVFGGQMIVISCSRGFDHARPPLPSGPPGMMLGAMPADGVGLFGLQISIMVPMFTLIVHLIYGAVLGKFHELLGPK